MRKIAFDENIAMDMLIDHTDNGMSFSKLAKKYGMSMSTAYRHVEKIKKMLDEKDSENTEIQPKDIEEDKNKPKILYKTQSVFSELGNCNVEFSVQTQKFNIKIGKMLAITNKSFVYLSLFIMLTYH